MMRRLRIAFSRARKASENLDRVRVAAEELCRLVSLFTKSYYAERRATPPEQAVLNVYGQTVHGTRYVWGHAVIVAPGRTETMFLRVPVMLGVDFRVVLSGPHDYTLALVSYDKTVFADGPCRSVNINRNYHPSGSIEVSVTRLRAPE